MALHSAESSVGICALAAEGVLKPPTIAHPKRELSFIFTPRPGKGRLTASNREIYERAMALVCAVRKGQLLPEAYRIHSPIRILSALRDRGYIRANTEAAVQYQNLVALRVGILKPAPQPRWMQFHLRPGAENRAALDLAIELLQTGQLANMEVNQDARIALTQGEKYIQSLVAASEIRKREKRQLDQEAASELEQFIFQFDT